MTAQTLLRTPWFAPHQVISWQAAVTLSFLGKVEVLETYDDEVRSPSVVIRAPAVVRLKRHPGTRKRGVKFSRTNVFVRDGFRCQYCGVELPAGELTYDHVVPRVQGGKTTWENIVAACRGCNAKKRGRTPEGAGMTLLRRPAKPKWLPAAPIVTLGEPRIPAAWAHYCAAN
ncbi:HNH endonuclease [Polyangium aurulentum]|uniref:HNH endonuclease n=1 Tax=Polyangium aurulentum TaxID=2567896 RepID=UPI0020102D50|nr:HNH endonuclease [Polyangium aurulentum]UQA58129.1 HNH endonuclease [Polyangium aurulentum]